MRNTTDQSMTSSDPTGPHQFAIAGLTQPQSGTSTSSTTTRVQQHFVDVIVTACKGHNGRANRAKLRRALRRSDTPPMDALRIIGSALQEKDTREEVILKVGVAGLYATYGKEGSSGIQWRTVGHVLRSNGSSDRCGREMQKLKHRLDRGDATSAVNALRLLLARADENAVARLDWGLLLTDLRNLLRGRHDTKAKQAWHRWSVGFARGDDNTDDILPPIESS